MLFINPLNFYIMEFKQVQVLKSVYLESPKGWAFHSETILNYTAAQYYTFVSNDTLQWFRRIGSRQVAKKQYTSFGHLVTQLSSYSPDNTEKHVYNFRFIY